MSADNVVGHRIGGDGQLGQRSGAYQFTALGTGGAVMDVSDWKAEYIDLVWKPATSDSDVLYYGFFPDLAAAVAGFDAATSSSGGPPVALVPTAPDFVERGRTPVTIPMHHKFLRVQASANTGRCVVRASE